MLVKLADMVQNVGPWQNSSRPLLKAFDPGREFYLLDQPISVASAGPMLRQDNTGAGSQMFASFAGAIFPDGPGGGQIGPFYQLETGTTTTGRCGWTAGNANNAWGFHADIECMYWRSIIRLNTLSTAGEEYSMYCGFADSTTVTIGPADGVGFGYDRLNLGVNWQAIIRAGSVGVPIDLGIPVDNNWHDFVVGWKNGAAHWSVDGNVVLSTAVGVPVTNQAFGASVNILKSAGTTSRTVGAAFQEVYMRWQDGHTRGVALPPFCD